MNATAFVTPKVQTVDRAIYRDEGGAEKLEDYWLVRIDGEARPGHFVDMYVAKYAMQFDDDTLKDLQDRANDRSAGTQGIVTQRDLELAYVRAEMRRAGEHIAREEWLDAGMTPDEVIIFSLTVTLWNSICDLTAMEDPDADDYMDAIHTIQRHLAARPFFRAATAASTHA